MANHKNTDKITHGCARNANRTPEYQTWINIRARCYQVSNNRFKSHGGRGIVVCERWLVFENFLADMGTKPSPLHSIDRRDNDGNYEPGNCRWATRKQQANNRRNNHFIAHNGQSQTLQQWSNEFGIDRRTLAQRIRNGWSMTDALAPIAH